MELQKLNPWNWFKHEEAESGHPARYASGKLGRQRTSASGSHPIMELHQQMDELFDDAFRNFGFRNQSSLFDNSNWRSMEAFKPSLNVSSDNRSYQVSVEAPGLSEEDINIEVSGDVLSISGEKQEEQEDKDRHFFRVERSYGAFRRTLALPDDANADEVAAKMKNGVLTINIPRREVVDSSVKKIPIDQ